MAGPTTEVLNDDIRVLRDEVHRVDLDVCRLSTKVGGIITTMQVLAVFTLATLLSGVWWGATLTAKLDATGARIDKLEAKVDKLEAKVDAIATRFDKLEASIGRLIELSKPPARP